MRIIVKKISENSGRKRSLGKRTAAVTAAAALALVIIRASVNHPAEAAGRTVGVSGSEMSQPTRHEPNEEREEELRPLNNRDSVTVDDELDDLLLDGEEIDSGISSSYNGKLDIPSNVRLDRLDFGSDFVKPLKKARVTSRFDYRVNPVTGRYVFHTGMDLGAAQGSDILAMKDGRVVSAGYSGGYGNVVILEHTGGIRTLYAHCSRLLVSSGERVSKGQVIALVGSTGNSTGPHLHIEFRKGGKRYDPEWVIGGLYN